MSEKVSYYEHLIEENTGLRSKSPKVKPLVHCKASIPGGLILEFNNLLSNDNNG